MKANWDYDVTYNSFSKDFQVLRSGVLMAVRVEVRPILHNGIHEDPLWAVWFHGRQHGKAHPRFDVVIRHFEDHFAAYFSRL